MDGIQIWKHFQNQVVYFNQMTIFDFFFLLYSFRRVKLLRRKQFFYKCLYWWGKEKLILMIFAL